MKKGFTLIELLIVVVIIVMMVLIAVPQFSKYGRRSDLSMKAEEFRLVVDNAYKYSSSPSPNHNGTAITFNYNPPVNTVANKMQFSDTIEPWTDSQASESWLEVSVPNDMQIENISGDASFDNKAVIYFVFPGKYIKDPADSGIGFRLSYIDTTITDFVDVNLFPTSTLSVANGVYEPRFEVIIDESWN